MPAEVQGSGVWDGSEFGFGSLSPKSQLKILNPGIRGKVNAFGLQVPALGFGASSLEA